MAATRIRSLLAALLVAGCATETARQPPLVQTPPPEAAPTPAPAPVTDPAPEITPEEARRMEAAVERPPELGIAPPLEEQTDAVELRFDWGGAELTADARSRLDRLSQRLLRHDDGYYVDLQGHTDGTGSEEANLELAEHRARVVREYLHRVHAIPMDRMGVLSLGSAAPATANDSAEGREKNRRVVVVVLRVPD